MPKNHQIHQGLLSQRLLLRPDRTSDFFISWISFNALTNYKFKRLDDIFQDNQVDQDCGEFMIRSPGFEFRCETFKIKV